jgi:tRNA(Arg) A34 adenosine deaminase TadA
MCTGAILWSGIKTLVVADRTTFEGPTARLRDEGVRVCFVDDPEAYETMRIFRAENSGLWAEDNAGK